MKNVADYLGRELREGSQSGCCKMQRCETGLSAIYDDMPLCNIFLYRRATDGDAWERGLLWQSAVLMRCIDPSTNLRY